MTPRYAVGIDLGTTNSVLAYTELGEEPGPVRLLPVPQLVAPGTVERREILTSFLYLATPEEASRGGLDLPWARGRDHAVGVWARQQAADLPAGTVAAAKSWLAHSRVDRRQPILPWNAPDGRPKVSPVEAARRTLAHLVAAWGQAMPGAPLAHQQVVLTVPASFDASARELTREAAAAAGLGDDLVLLEEPQAAFYAWLADRGETWRTLLTPGDRVLVCDIGGGTTDFTLIGVEDDGGTLALARLAVGNHILVGGDNMDLTLAHLATQAFQDQGVTVDPWQSVGLWHACRGAKERLLGPEAPASAPVSVLGRGRRLIGGTISVPLARAAALDLLLDGFLPACPLDARPVRRPASGFRELGLPFEQDTGITRHLAHLLTSHGTAGTALRPTHVLFNGGVLKAMAFRERLLSVLGSWFDAPPQVLAHNDDLDHAVARGAAYYGRVKKGTGIRIRGGTARSYYLGIESAGLAVPGAPRPLQALCVVPFGMEEGQAVDVPGEPMGLWVGEPAQFRFFGSTVRKDDHPGMLLTRWDDDELQETDPLEAHLAAATGFDDEMVPVRLQARITELGTFQLWCVSTVSDDRWKLEFSVRN